MKINSLETSVSAFIKIQRLPHYNLTESIDAVVEPDDVGFIARTIDLPLYAHSDDCVDAIDALKYEIESLYEDLSEEDDLAPEWLRIKKLLKSRIDN